MKHFYNLLKPPAQSDLYARYLWRLRLREISIRLAQLSLLLLLIGGWEAGVRLGWIDPFLFSSPSRIGLLFIQMITEGDLFHHIRQTALETLISFLLGTMGGTIIATVIWAFPWLARVLDPYLVILNSMPKVALGPLFIVTMGAGFGSILAMGIAITIIITTLVMYSSFQGVNPDHLKLARAFGATRWDLFRKIIFPASIPDLIAALKVNVGLAWVGVIVGEFLVSKAGLGYLIIYGFQVFNLTLVLLSLFVVAICATVMYQAVAYLEKRLLRHRQME